MILLSSLVGVKIQRCIFISYVKVYFFTEVHMRGKTVKVSEEIHIKLSLLKIKTKAKTFNDVIRMLIEKCGESVE